MATVGGVSGDAYTLPKVEPQHVKSLGQDEFLKLMISQLQNQDPTEPMDNSQMAAQMAQFSTLESVNAMSGSVQQSQTYNMIGKGVLGYTVNPDTGVRTEVMGMVESAGVSSGANYVMVGTAKVNLSDIVQVYDQNALTGISDAIQAATGMVGKYARVNLGTAAKPDYLEGIVSRWQVVDGVVQVTVGDVDVLLGQIVTVANNAQSLGEAPPLPEVPEVVTPEVSEEEEE